MGRLGSLVIVGAILVAVLSADVVAENLITNGEFVSNGADWTQISTQHANWRGSYGNLYGWDGLPGWFWVNHDPYVVPETSQLVDGLVAGHTYSVTGYYCSVVQWVDGPSFQALIDGDVCFSGGASEVSDWTEFTFTFTAADSDALLTFRSQVGSDSDYGIDNISMVPEPATMSLLALGGLALIRRRRK